MTRDEATLIIFKGMFIRSFDAETAARLYPEKWAQAQATVLALFYPVELPAVALDETRSAA